MDGGEQFATESDIHLIGLSPRRIDMEIKQDVALLNSFRMQAAKAY